MNYPTLICATAALLLWPVAPLQATDLKPAAKIVLPPPTREFRAVWVATVGNSCWPSKPGLTTAQQQAELLAILDRAAALKLNAVIFQVRPACDALYSSALEPWSEYLTGTQGRAPVPFYDPLAFAVAEAHRRGLELHAWFNPFRAHHFQAVSPIAANHISKLRPDLVRTYGRYLWLDPGDPDTRAWSSRVVLDVVKRYDVDGVHLDDYFYPYPEKNSAGAVANFPDDATWERYGVKSGLARDDWRRLNVDTFMQQLYHAIKVEKPWVKFGISPFGIWRPQNPPGITGFDSYTELYGDARKWLMEGWCDYFAPQLYWGIQPPAQSFPVLLDWWQAQNLRHRHVWPGMDSLKAGGKWTPAEIANQIALERRYPDPGHIHWNATALMKETALDTELLRETYREPALVPACPWLDATPPAMPKLAVDSTGRSAHVRWQPAPGKPIGEWVWQTCTNGLWLTRIFPGLQTEVYLDGPSPDAACLRAVDRVGNLSAPAVWIPRKYSAPVITHNGEKLNAKGGK